MQLYRDSIILDRRIDGRSRLERRTPVVHCNTVSQAIGSATFTLGSTSILTCIYAKLGTPNPNTPRDGKIVIHVNL